MQAVASEMKRPLFVKLPPWERSRQSRENGISLAETAIDAGANGVIIANTRPVEHVGLKVGRGGMSGAPLFDDTLRMTAEVRASLGRRGAIIACGGIGDARQVLALVGRWSRSRTTLYGPCIRGSRAAGVDQSQSGSPDGASWVQVCRGNRGPSTRLGPVHTIMYVSPPPRLSLRT